MADHSFVHLHLHSAYSLAEGAIRIKDLVKRCRVQGMPAVAVTDTNNLFGAMEFALAAADAGVQPILGAQLSMEDGRQLVLLVQDQAGYMNLSKLVSDAYMSGEGGKDFKASYDSLEQLSGGLICLSGGPAAGVTDPARLAFLKDAFHERFYIELQRHGLAAEDSAEGALIDFAYAEDIPLVATNDCYFTDSEMHEAHDALLCIAEGRYITEDDRRRVTPEHYFKSASEMMDLFADVPEAVANTVVIAQRCHFLLKPVDPILPPFETESGRSEAEALREQAQDGLEWRLKNFAQDADPEPYRERLEYELGIIEQMGFPGYFLIVSDFIKWAKDHDIPVGPGRGSGAGSVVAWALKITDLDPLKFNLLFERFLNPERVSMPDFDVDFCQDRRDEVIAYVQQRYGRDRVAQIITFGKLQARAVVRDVGRVLQMPYGAVDRLAKMIPNNPANPISLAEALEQDADLRAESQKDDTSAKLIGIALKLEGLYRHASTHAAGVVIGDRPLHELVPLYRDPRSDMPVTQFNMKYVEQTGLVKFDFLGLKTLTVIQKAVEFVERTAGRRIDVLQIPFEDDVTYQMLARGETTGVFQLESAGMRDLGKQMKISNFEQIIALVALYRPGPMENIPKYLACLHGQEERDYMHPLLEPVLKDTYGVMIYQEQVMQAAQILSGYSLGNADLLRRAMGKKIKEAMDAEREKFVVGAAEHKQIGADIANEIFDQIAKFAGYGFNKAHSAGYGLVSYWTAWLKANYPVEFMAASMTLDYGNTDKLAVFKQELDRAGIPLLPPDVNASDVMFSVEERDGKKAIRYALAALKGVGEGAMEKLVEERREKGSFKDLADFICRMDSKTMNKKQFEGLVCAGAFDKLYSDRAQLLAGGEMLLRHAHALAEERESGQTSLFGGDDNGADSGGLEALPPLPAAESWDQLEKLRREFDAVGFYISAHPLDARSEQLERLGIVPVVRAAVALAERPSSRLQMAGVLIRKQERISAKSGNKFAFLQVSDSTGVYEVMIFSDTLARCREFLNPGTALLLTVDAEVKEGEEQPRYTGQDIAPLDQALAGKLREVRVHLNGVHAVQPLKAALTEAGKGPVQVFIIAHLPGGTEAELSLRGRWSIPPDMLTCLRRAEGVQDVQER